MCLMRSEFAGTNKSCHVWENWIIVNVYNILITMYIYFTVASLRREDCVRVGFS